nr:receptor-like protein kinase 2 [Quercus suber]
MRQWIASLRDRMEVVDDGLLRIEDGRDVTVLQTILSSILELGLRCSEELPNGRFDIKDVVAKCIHASFNCPNLPATLLINQLSLPSIPRSTMLTRLISRLHRLRELVLSYNLLEGTLPMELCTHCPNLQGLYLSDNSLAGQLPSQIHYCRNLVAISLSYNKFVGSITKGIGSLENLELLYLGGNNLSGNIPPSLGNLSRLLEFAIEDNNIKGSIPSDSWHFTNLYILNFEFNDLTGTIPNNILNISSLQEISLVQNSLYGNLPLDAGLSCTNLEILYLAHNKLSGHIQSDISNCSNLAEVDFGRNSLSGPIPKSLGNLKYLRVLVLYDNQLTAEPGEQEMTFLSSLSSCIFLEELVISFNSLNTTIPDYIGNLSISLKKFIASYNQIKGQIPMKIGSLKNLTFLDLSYNNLTGNIPSTLGGVEGLQRLHLRVNNIGGNIPKELCQLRNLGQLVLSHNKISGSIPNCIGNLNLLQRLNLSHNGLTSSIPLEILVENKDATHTKTIGTIGYIAPEYGSEGRVSAKCDIYSYGIILLEMITRKKPTDEIFVAELGMRQWVASLHDRMEVVDDGLLRIEEGRDVTALQTILSSILELGLRCSEELPNGRLDIKDVVAKVNKIKLTLLGNRNRGV